MKKSRLNSASADDSSLKSLLEKNAELKQQLKQLKARKKYGLVWEEKTEDVVELCKKQLSLIAELGLLKKLIKA